MWFYFFGNRCIIKIILLANSDENDITPIIIDELNSSEKGCFASISSTWTLKCINPFKKLQLDFAQIFL